MKMFVVSVRFWPNFTTYPNTQNQKNLSGEKRPLQCWQADGQTDTKRLIVAFRMCCKNAPKEMTAECFRVFPMQGRLTSNCSRSRGSTETRFWWNCCTQPGCVCFILEFELSFHWSKRTALMYSTGLSHHNKRYDPVVTRYSQPLFVYLSAGSTCEPKWYCYVTGNPYRTICLPVPWTLRSSLIEMCSLPTYTGCSARLRHTV
jgi:hypothetical protein